jgi:hypothetical protein
LFSLLLVYVVGGGAWDLAEEAKKGRKGQGKREDIGRGRTFS